MNQIAIIPDALTLKRREAARKAVATRRARLASTGSAVTTIAAFTNVVPFKAKTPTQADIDSALAAFEAESGSDTPDWHRAALALRHALRSRPQYIDDKPRATKPAALPAPPWPDYDVKGVSATNIVNPRIVVTFADGEIVRAPAVGKRGKPVNIGRGLRVAIAFYQVRRVWRIGQSIFHARFFPAVPEITSCHCEDTGEDYNAELCNLKTVETRKARSR